MRTGGVLSAVVLACVWVVVSAPGAQAGEPPAEPARPRRAESAGPPPGTSVVNVRGLVNGNLDASRFLDEARCRSGTVRALVDALEGSDLLVFVELRPGVEGGTGWLQLLGGCGDYRAVHVALDVRRPLADRIGWLGHELWHAFEIATEPQVCDDDSLTALLQRIGYATGPEDESFETDGARTAGVRARREALDPDADDGC